MQSRIQFSLGIIGSVRSVAAYLAGLLVACAFSTTAFAAESGNLIVNGGGESGQCASTWAELTTVPGWTVVQGSPAVLCYTLLGSVPMPSSPVPGNAFIADGPFGDSALTQTVNVSSASTAIDAGGVAFNLSGWLGGWSDQTGQGMVIATFLDVNGKSLGTPAVLSGGSAAARKNTTEFLAATPVTGTVPAGTRSIIVLVQFFDTAHTSGNENEGYVDNLSLTLSTAVTSPTLQAPASTVPAFDHVFVVMEENTGYAQMISEIVNGGGTSVAPFMSSLIKSGTLLTNMSGTTHPSDPNYRAIAGGAIYADSNEYPLNDPNTNLADKIEAANLTWREYLQGMGTPCNVDNSSGDTQYDAQFSGDDGPFATYADIYTNATRCASHLFSTTQLTADDGGKTTAPIPYPGSSLEPTATAPILLPNFAWIGADDYDEGESSGNGNVSSVTTQDNWLNATLTPLLNSTAWTTSNSLLIITWDESYVNDGSAAPNTIATLLVGSHNLVRAGYSSNITYNHYSLARTIEAALNLGTMTGNDQYAQPINDAFTNTSQPTAAALSTPTPTVIQGTRVVFSYVTPSAQYAVTNWVGIYPTGKTPGQVSATQWGYITNATASEKAMTAATNPDLSTPALAQQTAGTAATTTTISDTPANGSISFNTTGLAPGTYSAWYLEDGGYTVLSGPINFTVVAVP